MGKAKDHSEHSNIDSSTTDFESNWQEYWKQFGHQLVLESWTTKYKDYINPGYTNNNQEATNSEEKALETLEEENTNSQSTNSDWNQLWDNHLEEQYSYYYQWFCQWWNSSQPLETEKIDVPEEFDHKSEESEIENKELRLNSDLPSAFDNLSMATSESTNVEELSDMEESKSEKTILQKTREYLDKLGLSSSLNEPGTKIVGCSLASSQKKKKKPKKKKNKQKKLQEVHSHFKYNFFTFYSLNNI